MNLKEKMKTAPAKTDVMALLVCVGLAAAVLFFSVYPVGYFDPSTETQQNHYAGYGFASLYDILENGFTWDTAAPPPNIHGNYEGTGPYIVEVRSWIALLYIPIFVSITLLGFLLSGRPRRLKPKAGRTGKDSSS